MKLYVPRVGEKIELIENWECNIFSEYRNADMFEALGIKQSNNQRLDNSSTVNITLPKGTVLIFDRIYIRKGDSSDFDSITFRIESSPMEELKKVRFWVKVDEVNKIDFKHFEEPEDKEIKTLKEFFRKMAKEYSFTNIHYLSEKDEGRIIEDAIKIHDWKSVVVNINLKDLIKETISENKEQIKKYNQAHWSGYQRLESAITELEKLLLEEKDKNYTASLNICRAFDSYIYEVSLGKNLESIYNKIYSLSVYSHYYGRHWNNGNKTYCKTNEFNLFEAFGAGATIEYKNENLLVENFLKTINKEYISSKKETKKKKVNSI